ncbi:MAG: hypothetical protein ACK4RK_16400 [Gemmataceae bacterium]
MSDTNQQIGSFTFTVAFGEPAPEARSRVEQRADAITAWLLAQWLRSREEVQRVERN